MSRSLRFEVRVTAQERDRWVLAAEHYGIAVSELVRVTMNSAADQVLRAIEPVKLAHRKRKK